MITATSLRAHTSRDLAQMAKKKGVNGWHSMRKDELIKALVQDAKKSSNGSKANKPAGGNSRKTLVKSTSRDLSSTKPARKTNRKVLERIKAAAQHRLELKNLARDSSMGDDETQSTRKDRIVLLVRDPFWLHAHWDINRSTIDRISAAMSEHWHGAVPVLRLSMIESINTTSTSESVVRDIEVHGGVSNWYIDVIDPPMSYRVTIGYKAKNGKFYPIARSNKVTTPQPGKSDTVDENWTDIASDCEKVYALSGGYQDESNSNDLRAVLEEQVQRPIGTPAVNRFGIGADGRLRKGKSFDFTVDAEMVIYGATEPNSFVTLAGEPIKLREDGTFTVRCSLPDKRQVLPVVANSSDGIERRTTVLAIERNTKVMEPMTLDEVDLD